MIGKTGLAFLAVVVPMVAAPAIARERLPRDLARLSPSDFASRVRVVDDGLKPTIVLSSRDGYKRSRSIGGARAQDVHLEVLIDRETGHASWRVWHELSMVGARQLRSVEYTSLDGRLEQSGLLVLEHWQDECPPTDGIGSCNHFVRVAFELPERAVREIADAYHPGERSAWPVRFREASGRDIVGSLAPAEAAGLVLALEQWRQRGTRGRLGG